MLKKLGIISSILILFSSCMSYYVPDVYQTADSRHADDRAAPATEKIEDFSLIKFPDSINSEALDETTDVYVGISNFDGYGVRSKPYGNGQSVFISPGGSRITYFFESHDSSINRTEYHYFLVNFAEKSTGKQIIDVSDINNQTANSNKVNMKTIFYENSSQGIEWEAISLEYSFYVHVKTNSKPGKTDVAFLCIDVGNQSKLLKILNDQAIYSDDGFHIATGLDKEGYDKAGYNEQGLDRSGKTREENQRLAEETQQDSVSVMTPSKNVAVRIIDLDIPEGPQPILTVMDFNSEGVSSQEAIFISEYLSSCLFDTKAYRIIDRSKRETILEEIKFSNSGCSDESCQIEIGKLLAADKIVVGSIGKVGSRYMFNVKLLEVVSGETISTGYDVFSSIDDLIDGCSAIATQLTQGYIDSVD